MGTRRLGRVSRALVGFVLAALCATPGAAAQRAFVSSYGSDSNTTVFCNRLAPCSTFAAAISVVDPGGEVLALDAGEYGTVVISKALTLGANPGFFAGITVSKGTAIGILTNHKVILRGLDIRGTRATDGITSLSALSNLDVENCRLSGFRNAFLVAGARLRVSDTVIAQSSGGITFLTGPRATLDVANSRFLGNTVGLDIAAVSLPPLTLVAGSISASLSDSVVSGGAIGVDVHAYETSAKIRLVVNRSIISAADIGIRTRNASGSYGFLGDVRVNVGDSQITGNQIGFQVDPLSTFETMGTNVFSGNSNADFVGPVFVTPGT